MLCLRDVNAYYDKSHILFDVNLDLDEGQSVCILGRNGVGKTTTLKTIMGLLNPKNRCKTEGSIKIADRDLVGLTPYQIAALGIAYVPQGRHIFRSLTTKENLLIAEKKGKSGNAYWNLSRIYETFPRLREREHSIGGRLSGGEQQMLAIGRGLMQNPKLLILDEITEGLAPIIVNQLTEIVMDLVAKGVTILLAEQNVKFAMTVSQDCYILEKGSIVHHEPTAKIGEDTILKYLGT